MRTIGLAVGADVPIGPPSTGAANGAPRSSRPTNGGVGRDDPARRRDMRYCPLERADEGIGAAAIPELPVLP